MLAAWDVRERAADVDFSCVVQVCAPVRRPRRPVGRWRSAYVIERSHRAARTAASRPVRVLPSSTGAQTWTTQEKSTSAGTLTTSPRSRDHRYAADGSGTMGSSMSRGLRVTDRRTITFTYTAPAVHLQRSVTVAVRRLERTVHDLNPAGYSPPAPAR